MTVTDFFLMTLGQTAIGLVLDGLMGDPYWFPHPARTVGHLISFLERHLRARFINLRVAGFLLCAITTILPSLLALLTLLCCRAADAYLFSPGTVPWLTIGVGGLICGIWFSFRSLASEARKVQMFLAAGRLEEARRALAMIVGRDTDHLNEAEMARATIETVAENSVDGGVSPVIFSILGGPVLVTFFKAVSTLDSMVGYRNERYRDLGMVSARLDDILNYLPARLCYLFIPLAAFWSRLSPVRSLRIGLRDGDKHPSPNSAIGESLFAGALNIQLGGPSTYHGVVSNKPLLGDPGDPIIGQKIALSCRLLFLLDGFFLVGTTLALALLA